MTIHVTEDDIKKGQRDNPSCCPVAKALRRYKPGMTVGRIGLYQSDGTMHPMPDAVETFVDCFDNGKPVQPFTFELPSPH